MKISSDIDALATFQGKSLTRRIAEIESRACGLDAKSAMQFSIDHNIDQTLMASALSIKQLASQINVVIHAVGIMCSLPSILKPNEIVESVSLGAGNTGRAFDLETNHRVAEFKFIDWQGGAESIRQNGIFKDFFFLAEHETKKSKHLYVVGIEYPLRFLKGGRALNSVLSKQPEIAVKLNNKYGDSLKVVRDYYFLKETEVEIADVSRYIGRDPDHVIG